jgi:RNA polymerase sigma-70 factor, ECF subfamily
VDADDLRVVDCGREQLEAWIAEAKGGSTVALGRLLEACRNYLNNLAAQAISPTLRAKVAKSDLVQETSLDAHCDFVEFRGKHADEFLAWLRKILWHNAKTAARRYQSTKKRQVGREISLHENPDIANQLKYDALSPRSLLVLIEEKDRVERALQQLPHELRTAILLRSRDHLSFAEIGLEMQRSAEAARKLWGRAVEYLQRQILHETDGNS